MLFDIAFSLNRSMKVEADSYEEAEEKIKQQLKDEGINLDLYAFEEFDTVEEDD